MAEIMEKLRNENDNFTGEYLDHASKNEEIVATAKIKIYLPYVNITGVQVVHNNFLKGLYELKKEEYKSRQKVVTELELVHATSMHNVDSIIKNNLDWRRVTRNKYGVGVSFSPDADYANYHCNIGNGSDRAFIVCDVIVSHICEGSSTMKVPNGIYDTAKSSNGKVYVKFNDNEFLPKYVVYYDAPDRSKSAHHRRFRPRHRGLWYI